MVCDADGQQHHLPRLYILFFREFWREKVWEEERQYQRKIELAEVCLSNVCFHNVDAAPKKLDKKGKGEEED